MQTPSDYRSGTSPSARIGPELLRAYEKGIQQVDLLRELFGRSPVPRNPLEWVALPTTSVSTYSTTRSISSSFRGTERVYAPAAPLDLRCPSFPLAVLQSHSDKTALDERLLHVLKQLGCGHFENFVFVSGRSQHYFAADIAELLVTLGHGCRLLISEEVTTDTYEKLNGLGAQYIFWLHQTPVSSMSLPDCVQALTTFNSLSDVSFIRHFDVWHLDEAPLLAISGVDRRYSLLPGHFHVETVEGELTITTLKQDLLPLVRYRTGWLGRVSEKTGGPSVSLSGRVHASH